MRLSSFIICSLFLVFTSVNVSAKSVYGLYEKVRLPELKNASIKAKLDTGARTSSLGATNIKFFEKNGEEWVRFKPQINNVDLPEIEKQVIRVSKIKIRNDDISFEDYKLHSKRPVVMMEICFDGTPHLIEVNLTDRSRFNYPLLFGSSSLVELKAIVDPSLKFQSKKVCKR